MKNLLWLAVGIGIGRFVNEAYQNLSYWFGRKMGYIA